MTDAAELRVIRIAVTTTYCYLCGFAKGSISAGGDGGVRADTLRDLEQALLDLGMTKEEVAHARDSALSRKPEGT